MFQREMLKSSTGDYVFLTGATGMLGIYFLRSLLLRGVRVAVLVRPSHGISGKERIDSMLSLWEGKDTSAIPRPLVIEGDLSGDGWLMENKSWFRENVSTVIHSAASLVFYGEENCEPYSTNFLGIQTILKLCETAGIHKFHHVSTAYVAGSSKQFSETERNEGQKFRNDYEKSKMRAEEMVHDFGFDSLTVYRPSIVIGDTKTGYSATFSGVYAALKLVHTLVSRLSLGATSANFALKAMGLRGNECKNLVPVDWVSEVLLHIFEHEELHGKTYHLTNPNPIPMKQLAQAIQETVERYSQLMSKSDMNQYDEEWFATNFTGEMKLFRAYINHDPEFSSKNTETAAPHLPCPEVNKEMLMFLFHRAIESRFGKAWHKIGLNGN